MLWQDSYQRPRLFCQSAAQEKPVTCTCTLPSRLPWLQMPLLLPGLSRLRRIATRLLCELVGKIAKTREEDLGRPLSSGLHKSLPLFFPLVLVRFLAFFVLDLKQSPFLSYVGWWLATEDRSIGFYNTKRPRSMRGSADPLFFSTRALSDPSRSIVFYNTKRPRSKPIRGTDRPIHWFFPHGPFPIQADPA